MCTHTCGGWSRQRHENCSERESVTFPISTKFLYHVVFQSLLRISNACLYRGVCDLRPPSLLKMASHQDVFAQNGKPEH